MQDFKSFSESLTFFDFGHFENLALELFQYQAVENDVYNS